MWLWSTINSLDKYLIVNWSINIHLPESYEFFVAESHFISKIYKLTYSRIFFHSCILIILTMPFVLLLYVLTTLIWSIIIIFLLLFSNHPLDYYKEYPFDNKFWLFYTLVLKNILFPLIFLSFMCYINIEFIINNPSNILIVDPISFLMGYNGYSHSEAIKALYEIYGDMPPYFECKKIIKSYIIFIALGGR